VTAVLTMLQHRLSSAEAVPSAPLSVREQLASVMPRLAERPLQLARRGRIGANAADCHRRDGSVESRTSARLATSKASRPATCSDCGQAKREQSA
jgi:hypothetical protein